MKASRECQGVSYRYIRYWQLVIVCRFDLDKKFSELVGCLAFDSDSNLSHSTDDRNTDTESSLESLISLGNICKLTTPPA